MKKILLLSVLTAITLVSCVAPSMLSRYGYAYEYKHRLIGDKTIGDTYKDENIEISFAFPKTELDFDLKNLTQNPIKIIWDEVSFVQYGEGKRIFHKGVKYTERSNPQVPSIVPVGTSYSDLITPIDNVSFDEGYYVNAFANQPARWVTSDLWFPNDFNKPETQSHLIGLKGWKYKLLLPMEINGVKKNYTFEFEITDVNKFEPQTKPNF
jgi:hypothetical protein